MMTSETATLLREAWLLRSDKTISKVMLHRKGRLYEDRLELFHLKDKEQPELEQVISLKGSSVSEVKILEADVKPRGHNLFYSYVAGDIKPLTVGGFTLHYVKSRSRRKVKLRDVTLAFEDEGEAQEWAATLGARGGGLAAVNSGHGRSPSSFDGTSTFDGADADGGSTTMDFAETPRAGREDSMGSDAVPRAQVRLPATAPLDPSAVWQSTYHWNGMAVYQEGSTSGAHAVAAAMRASPRDVFRHFIRANDGTCAWDLLRNVRVLDDVQDNDQKLIFTGSICWTALPEARMESRSLFAHRDVVLEQTWSHDEEDGVFDIVLASVEHSGAPPPPPWNIWQAIVHWTQPVRAKVRHMGITISPLRADCWPSSGRDISDSPDAMVTIVVDLDLGGVFGSPWFRWLLPRLSTSWLRSLLSSVVQIPHLQSFVQTRDNVEQLRYVAPPVSLLAKRDPSTPTTTMYGHAASGATVASPRASSHALQSRVSLVRGHSAGPAQLPGHPASPRRGVGGADAAAALSQRASGGVLAPHTWLNPKFYSSPSGSDFRVRGKTYLSDRKKVPSAEPGFELLGVEAVTTDAPDVLHISRYLPLVMHSAAAFLMPVHFTLPCMGKNMHLICVFGLAGMPDALAAPDEPFTLALGEYYGGTGAADDKRRRGALKLIPSVKAGSWVMRQAVGSTPFIIGNKLNTTYHRGANYLETTIDINSNGTAARITNYVAPALTGMVLHLGFVLEGKKPEHLPEQLLGTVALNNLDLKLAKHLDTSKPLQPRGVAAAGPASGLPAAADGAAPPDSARSLQATAPLEQNSTVGVASNAGGHRHHRKMSVADGETPLRDVLARGLHGSGGGSDVVAAGSERSARSTATSDVSTTPQRRVRASTMSPVLPST